MIRKIPPEALEYYVSLGPARSYQLVANHYGVSKRGVTKAAARERWTERLEKIEREVQARADERLTETIDQMRVRHTKMLRAMASRAVKAIQEYPLTSGMEGLRAAEAVIKLERLVAGDVTERSEVSLEQIIRREHERIMVPVDDEADDEDSAPSVQQG